MRKLLRSGSWSLAALCLVMASACGSSPPPGARPNGRVAASYSPETGRLKEITYDRNNDGKVDTWATMDGPSVVAVRIDLDGDGKVDRWEYYTPATTPGQPSVLTRVETATRHDGRVSRREFLEAGRLVRVEEDTDGDGVIDKWETYRNGALTVLELDTRHRGKPDQRLVYGPDGAVERMESDPDGSGRFQVIPPRR